MFYKSLLTVALFAVGSLGTICADTSPNGKEYTVCQDGMYFILRPANQYGQQYYELTDADYIEDLVIPDDVDGIPVEMVSNMNDRTDFESISFGANLGNHGYIDFLRCTYVEKVDFSRCTKSMTARIWECSITELEIPDNVTVDARSCTELTRVAFTGGKGNSGSNFSGCTKLSEVTFHPEMQSVPRFSDCTSLTRVDLPVNALSISLQGFKNCSALAEVNIPEGSKLAFIYSESFSGTPITRFDCPDGVKVIDAGAFAGTKITEFKLPAELQAKFSGTFDGVNFYGSTSTMDLIFDGCSQLQAIDYPSVETLLAIQPKFDKYKGLGRLLEQNGKSIQISINGASLEELTIPTSVTTAYFNYISGPKKLTFANRTTSIAGECNNIPTLETVSLGAGVTDVTFAGCTNLTTVDVSDKNRTTRLSNTFNGCTALQAVYYPLVTDIDYNTFHNCTSLSTVSLPKLTTIGQSAFDGCSALKTVDFPSVTGTIYFRAFLNCPALKSVNLPAVTVIDNNAFENCASLTDINIPAVTKIKTEAFKNCSSLSAFNFSETITYIGSGAFYGTAFTSVNIPITCQVERSAFDNCPELRELAMPVYYWVSVANLPKAEKMTFTSVGSSTSTSLEPRLDIVSCGGENDLDITVLGDIAWFSAAQITNFNRLTLRGCVTEDFYLAINTVPRQLDVRSLDDYLNSKFRNNAFTPGYFADVIRPIDFFIMGEPMKDLYIAPGTNLPDYAFNMFNLETITFQGFSTDAATTINKATFKNCVNLREVKFYGNVTYIGQEAFMNTGLVSIEMPSTVTGIGVQCFASCENLRHITFSPSLKHFADGSVNNTPALERLIVPEGVETLGYQIINGPTSKQLQTVSLPSTLTFLSSGFRPSFQNLSSDVEFLSWATVAPGGNMDNFSGMTVHVPVGCADNYRRKNLWTNANLIEDLLVSQNTEVSGTTVSIVVPKQTSISGNADVALWIVDCYDGGEPSDAEPIATYKFDAAGNPLKTPAQALAASNTAESQLLTIRDLDPYKTYHFDVKGLTATNDLVYHRSASASTGESSAADAAIANDIVLRDNDLIVPAAYGGCTLQIFALNGEQLFSTTIADGGETITLSLRPGVYALSCGKTTLKLKL